MDVDSLAASCIAGRSTTSAVDARKPMWRTVRRLLPKLLEFRRHHGPAEPGEYHRLATGEAAS